MLICLQFAYFGFFMCHFSLFFYPLSFLLTFIQGDPSAPPFRTSCKLHSPTAISSASASSPNRARSRRSPRASLLFPLHRHRRAMIRPPGRAACRSRRAASPCPRARSRRSCRPRGPFTRATRLGAGSRRKWCQERISQGRPRRPTSAHHE